MVLIDITIFQQSDKLKMMYFINDLSIEKSMFGAYFICYENIG